MTALLSSTDRLTVSVLQGSQAAAGIVSVLADAAETWMSTYKHTTHCAYTYLRALSRDAPPDSIELSFMAAASPHSLLSTG